MANPVTIWLIYSGAAFLGVAALFFATQKLPALLRGPLLALVVALLIVPVSDSVQVVENGADQSVQMIEQVYLSPLFAKVLVDSIAGSLEVSQLWLSLLAFLVSWMLLSLIFIKLLLKCAGKSQQGMRKDSPES